MERLLAFPLIGDSVEVSAEAHRVEPSSSVYSSSGAGSCLTVTLQPATSAVVESSMMEPYF